MAAGDVWGNSWLASWGSSWKTASAPVAPTVSARSGVRHSRFLRRSKTAPLLPWEIEDKPQQEVVVAKPRRKRIPLPAVKAMRDATGGAIPIRTVREISAPVISIPDGKAVRRDDDEDLLWMI